LLVNGNETPQNNTIKIEKTYNSVTSQIFSFQRKFLLQTPWFCYR